MCDNDEIILLTKSCHINVIRVNMMEWLRQYYENITFIISGQIQVLCRYMCIFWMYIYTRIWIAKTIINYNFCQRSVTSNLEQYIATLFDINSIGFGCKYFSSDIYEFYIFTKQCLFFFWQNMINCPVIDAHSYLKIYIHIIGIFWCCLYSMPI